jgi:3-oxoacyl-[acyl-carrier protein] reductase
MTDAPLLAGKVAVVSGGSRGIGRAIVLALASEGADVAFSYRKENRAAKEVAAAVERLGRRVLAVPSDASQFEETEEFVQHAKTSLGRIDVVVANAGIGGSQGWETLSPTVWREYLDTNLVGPYSLVSNARRFLPPTGGSVIFVSSIAALLPYPRNPAYAAAKAGLLSLTRTLAAAMAPSVRVNAVAPGWVRTDLTAPLHDNPRPREAIEKLIPRGRWGEPDDVAAAVVFLSSDGARFITGETLVVDGGTSIRWTAGVEP